MLIMRQIVKAWPSKDVSVESVLECLVTLLIQREVLPTVSTARRARTASCSLRSLRPSCLVCEQGPLRLNRLLGKGFVSAFIRANRLSFKLGHQFANLSVIGDFINLLSLFEKLSVLSAFNWLWFCEPFYRR